MKKTNITKLFSLVLTRLSLSRECTIIMCFILCFGVSTGIFFETLMSNDMKSNMQGYLKVLFEAIEGQPLDITAITSALFLNIAAVLLICISGCTKFCSFTSIGIFFIKGLSLGYCCALILETYSTQGLLLVTLTILPQNTILLPALLIGSNVAYMSYSNKNKFSSSTKKGRALTSILFEPAYLCIFLFLVAIIAISCFIQLSLLPLVTKLL